MLLLLDPRKDNMEVTSFFLILPGKGEELLDFCRKHNSPATIAWKIESIVIHTGSVFSFAAIGFVATHYPCLFLFMKVYIFCPSKFSSSYL